MATFVGSYVNKIDRKGRVSVPARFRAAIADQSFPGVVVAPSYELGAIDGCDHDRVVQVANGLDDPEFYTPEDRELASLILAKAEELPFDQDGRVLLPRDLLDLAAITDRAAFVGVGPTFQIWEPARYEAHEGQALERVKRGTVDLRMLRVPRLRERAP